METSLPTPMTARVYVNLPEGKAIWEVNCWKEATLHALGDPKLQYTLDITWQDSLQYRSKQTRTWHNFAYACSSGIPITHLWIPTLPSTTIWTRVISPMVQQVGSQHILIGGFQPFWKIFSQLGWLSHILWKIKNAWNHQPVAIVGPQISRPPGQNSLPALHPEAPPKLPTPDAIGKGSHLWRYNTDNIWFH